jgi:DNA helicase HerA-like ATPase
MRTTVSDMGPQLLSRLLGLNDTQEGILNIVFRIADDRGLLLIDMKDLRAMLSYVAENAKQYTAAYGNIAPQSVGAIQRALLTLENQGADKFFAEPSFDIYDLLQCEQGKGVMNVLAADKLMLQPKLYSTFLLWLLSELYAQLPEVGDMELPKLVFFFDEAHMLFDETSKALVDKIEQVVRLIRSKGVGVYFVTQSPTDIPEEILGQLGNRVQHALRAFTPKDQKAVKTAAETFRANPSFKTADAIMELGTGEALVSFLDEKGAPSMVERARILFPLSQIGAVTEGQRGQIINQSRLYGKYDKVVDRESAFEVLMEEAEAALKAEQETAEAEAKSKKSGKGNGILKGIFGAVVGAMVTSVTSSIGTEVSRKVTGKKSRTTAKDIAGRAVGSAARTATRQLTRSVLGTLIK